MTRPKSTTIIGPKLSDHSIDRLAHQRKTVLHVPSQDRETVFHVTPLDNRVRLVGWGADDFEGILVKILCSARGKCHCITAAFARISVTPIAAV